MPDTVEPVIEDTGLAIYQPSESSALSAALTQFGANFHTAAEQSILGTIGPDDGYTETEIQAMISLEELRMVNGMDLYTILYRGKLIHDIEDRGLWSRHPNGFQTMEEAAAAQGISASEYSNIRDLTGVIFPYIEETLGMPIAQIWDHVRKSNFREMVPVLKAIITGEAGLAGTTRSAVQRILEETGEAMRATAEQNGEEAPGDDDIRRQAVSDLLVAGEQMSNRELRNHIRNGARTPSISPAVVRNGEQRIFVVTLDEDQYQAMLRKLGGFAEDPIQVTLPDDPAARQREAARVRVLRDITNLILGG